MGGMARRLVLGLCFGVTCAASAAGPVYEGKFKVVGASPAECAFVFEKPGYEVRFIRLNSSYKALLHFEGETGAEFLDGINLAGYLGPDSDFVMDRTLPLSNGDQVKLRAEGVVTPRFLLVELTGAKVRKGTEVCRITGEFSGFAY